MAARFEWLRAWQLDEPIARSAKARWLKQKRQLARFAAREQVPSPESLIQHWLSSGEVGSASAWVPLSTVLFFKEGERRRTSFDADVTQSDGWMNADESRQNSIRALARRFLIECADRSENSATSNYTFAGYRAGVLLRENMRADSELKRAFSEKWLMSVLDFPNNAEPLHQTMVKFAYELDREACVQKLYQDLLKDNGTHGFMHALQPFKGCWNSELCELVKHFAVAHARPQSIESILHFLADVDQPCALACFEGLLDRAIHDPTCHTDFQAHLLAAAICYLPAGIWSFVWPMLIANDDLARAVFLRVANNSGFSGDGVAAKLSPEQIADLYCLLAKIFPSDQDPKQQSGTVTARMSAAHLRDGQLRLLVAIANEDACRQLLRLASLFPKQRLWLHWQYRECLTAKRRILWVPKEPSLVLWLLKRAKHRVITNEDDLLDLVVESLDRLQNDLTKGPNPQAGDLWNYEGSGNKRRNFAPKDEEDISGKIAAWIQRDLGPSSGVVLNREVQPRRGQKTDVLVDAVANSEPDKRRITIVIEVKGCWHAEVRTAIETQLVETYLKSNGWSHGIYLVAWFMCSRWDHPDKPPASNLRSTTFDEALAEVCDLAAPFDGQKSLFVVRSYLLDCRHSG